MGKYVIKQAKSGPMFNLKARNGEIIGTSEIYTSLDACKNGIASVQKNAPVAALEDQTKEGYEIAKNPKLNYSYRRKLQIQGRLQKRYCQHPQECCRFPHCRRLIQTELN